MTSLLKAIDMWKYGWVAAIIAAGLPNAAWAQRSDNGARTTVAIGTVTSQQECTIYSATSGHRNVYIDPYTYASSTSWMTWLYKDCVSHFPELRMAMEAALASSGKIAVGRGGYTLSVNLSGVSGEGGPAPAPPVGGRNSFLVSSSKMMVNMDITLRDRAGRIIFGDLVTKAIETGSNVTADGLRATSSQSGEATYAVLQRAVALAAARKIAFRLSPMRVVDNSGKRIQLNYGGPLLEMGMIVQVTSPTGGESIRYRVAEVSGQSALAEPYSDGDRSKIVAGSTAIVIENDDPAANGRRYDKVDLP
jgi:hypothetical protein